MLPLRASVRSELRIPVVYRDPPRFPACSICKPPRNESVNPVTSFAAILALRRRRRWWYSHFPPNPPACLRLQCKSVETPIHRRRHRSCCPIGPHANSLTVPIIAGVSALLPAISLSFMPSPFLRVYGFHRRISRSRSLRTSSRICRCFAASRRRRNLHGREELGTEGVSQSICPLESRL